MMTEENPAIGGVKVLAIVKTVGRSDPAVVEHRDLGRQKRAVIPISDRENPQDDQHHRHRMNWHRQWSVVSCQLLESDTSPHSSPRFLRLCEKPSYFSVPRSA